MGEKITRNIIRFVFLFLLQVLIFKRVDLSSGSFDYIHLLVYPLVILLLPINTPKAVILLIAFFLGLTIDGFYNSPGVHAGALVITAYFRNLVLKILEPYEGYGTDISPTLVVMGFPWFISYASILSLIHCFAYFSLDAFSFVYLYSIILNTIFSFIASLFMMLIIQFIFRTKY